MTYLDCMLQCHKELGIPEEKSAEIIRYADMKLLSVGGNPDRTKNKEVEPDKVREVIDYLKALNRIPGEVLKQNIMALEEQLSVNNKNN